MGNRICILSFEASLRQVRVNLLPGEDSGASVLQDGGFLGTGGLSSGPLLLL